MDLLPSSHERWASDWLEGSEKRKKLAPCTGQVTLLFLPALELVTHKVHLFLSAHHVIKFSVDVN